MRHKNHLSNLAANVSRLLYCLTEKSNSQSYERSLAVRNPRLGLLGKLPEPSPRIRSQSKICLSDCSCERTSATPLGAACTGAKFTSRILTNLLLSRFADSAERNFIDVGANIGYFSCLMSKLAGPAGKVLAVEPEPQNLTLLQENIAINHLTNVVVHPCAWAQVKAPPCWGCTNHPIGAATRSWTPPRSREFRFPSGRWTISLRIPEQMAKSWSLVKIDVEGYEAFVLDGAKGDAAANRDVGHGILAGAFKICRGGTLLPLYTRFLLAFPVSTAWEATDW